MLVHRLIPGLLFIILLACEAPPVLAQGHLRIAGMVRSPQGKGIKEISLEVRYQGLPLTPPGEQKELRTGSGGSFAGEFLLPPGVRAGEEVEIQARKPAWRPSGPVRVRLLAGEPDSKGNLIFYAQPLIILERQVTPAFWAAAVIPFLVYLLISLEWLHRTLAALLGATLMLFISYSAGTFSEAFLLSPLKMPCTPLT